MLEKKTVIKRIIAIVSMILIVIASVDFLQDYFKCMINQNVIRIKGFYNEDRNSLDVVFIGASDVYSGYLPSEAYRTARYTSYNYAYSINPVIMWKYELREILKRQHPKVLVIECSGATHNKAAFATSASLYYTTKYMPLNKDKIEVISRYGGDQKLSYYIPFYKYHNTWGGPSRFDLLDADLKGYNLLRGAFSHKYLTKMKRVDDPAFPRDGSKAKLDPTAEEALREFLEECHDSEIEHIVFTKFPRVITNKKQYVQFYQRYNTIKDIVTADGFDYLDLDTEEFKQAAGLDFSTDYYDADHMVTRGQKKFTQYFSKILAEKYSLEPTALTPKQQAEWEESVRYIDLYYQAFEEDFEYNKKHHNKSNNYRDGRKVIQRLDELAGS